MRRFFPFAALAAAALFSACAATKPAQKPDDKAAAEKSAAAASAPAAPPSEVVEASLRAGEFAPRADLKPVPFDYDSAKLSDEALAALKANAEIIKADPSLEVMVAGHCDERGTVAYNLALGQKRAKEVRDYYIRLGVDGARAATLSYGKEQPLCAEPNEACWARNRRAETRARARADKASPSAPPP